MKRIALAVAVSSLLASACGPGVWGDPSTSHDEAISCAGRIAGMACIAGGTFMMGSEGAPAALPIHQVTVRPFHMDLYEVTVAQYGDCVSAGGCTEAGQDNDCNYAVPARADHPINCVDWVQAAAFCDWSGKRLPTEEEWEYAARNRGKSTYPWGDAPPEASWVNFCGDECTGSPSRWGEDGFPRTAPVGSFSKGDTADMLGDMAGNLWEWVDTRYCDYPSSPCNSCPAAMTCVSPCADCSSPLHGIRGASWAESWTSAIFQLRGSGILGTRYIGFRCAR